MVKTAFLFGTLLTLNGIAGYALADAKSATAFIPSAFGVALLLCGLIAMLAENARMHAMHISAMVGLLGILGAVGNLVRSLGSENSSKLALGMTVLMLLLSVLYLAACIKSFKAARRARQAEADP